MFCRGLAFRAGRGLCRNRVGMVLLLDEEEEGGGFLFFPEDLVLDVVALVEGEHELADVEAGGVGEDGLEEVDLALGGLDLDVEDFLGG